MTFRTFRGLLMVTAIAAAGCTGGAAQPSAVVGVPVPVSPANNASVGFTNQPVVLVAANTVASGATTTLTYTFEVATDAGFANTVQTKDAAQGSSGQTNVALDTLQVGKDYFWHVRASGGGTTGVFSGALKFTIVPLSAPTPLAPANGAVVTGWPTFTVADVQAPVGSHSFAYRFEISTSSTFATIAASGTVPETPTQTSFTPTATLPTTQTTMFWRVTAIDQSNGTSSPTTAIQSFVMNSSVAAQIAAQAGIALWPGTQPPGSAGKAVLGDNWAIGTQYYAPTNTFFQSPTAEMLRLFDLIDRGLDPQAAIDWMNTNGYSTAAQWYPPPEKAVIGLQYVYLGCVPVTTYPQCKWDVIVKIE